MPPTIITNCSIVRPYVKRAPAAADVFDKAKLPLGIRLTGGQKLRDAGKTGKGVRVAVIDSGVDSEHPNFNDRVKMQKWFRYGTSLTVDDHGTHVAGTIHMMAPDAEIYDYRVFGEEGGFAVDDAIATSIIEAVFDGCDVINMSLGGRWPSPSIRAAVDFAYNKGVYIVCAAGNEGDNDPLTHERSFPAMWDEAISVAAVQKKEGLPVARFSNSDPEVDYAGIGVNVVSLKPGGGYQEMSGTSMASPHVAGLIAALLSSDDEESLQKKKDTIKNDKKFRALLEMHLCIDIEVKGPDTSTGAGFLTYLNKEELDALLPEL